MNPGNRDMVGGVLFVGQRCGIFVVFQLTQEVALKITLRLTILLFGVIITAFPAIAPAQTFGTGQHNVTVTVNAITVIQVSSSNVNLTVTGASVVAGQDAMTVTDNSTTLLWGTNSSLRKISVSTSLAAPKYTLKLLALNPTVGTAQPQVTLSTTSTDLLLNLARSSGSCTLQYTGIALASTGSGSDAHTITFTILAQ